MSQYYTVMAVTNPSAGARGISAFVMEKTDPGVGFGAAEKKLGIKGSPTRAVIMEDARIPADRIIGAEGTGFKTALATLDHTRITIAAQALGIAQGALDCATGYVQQRQQFGQPVTGFQSVEFDVDLVLQDGECVFSSVSQNWPTAEPSFQETGLHLPPDHDKKAVRELVDLSVRTVQSFGFRRGVLHVEGKCTSRGPRVVEVNSRMGGGRIHQMVEAVWGVDLIEAQLRSCLDLPQALMPSRKPRCAVVDAIVYAPATGRLAELPFAQVAPEDGMGVELDIYGQIGQEVAGPDSTFATVLAELTLSGKNLRYARRRAAQVLRDPPRILPP